jgi:hypothetical protein
MTTPRDGLEIVPVDPWDAALVDAWHGVYLLAATHELGEVVACSDLATTVHEPGRALGACAASG